MKSVVAIVVGVAASLFLPGSTPGPAEACGVKLTVKKSSPRKAVRRTSNPSRVLLVGSHPRRLERDLAAAGHQVDTASTASNAKDGSYAVVIVDSEANAGPARSRFGND